MLPLAPIEKIRSIFRQTTSVAVVGLSPKADRPSNRVALYLKQAGFQIVPVNPGQSSVLGEPCYPDLQSIPHHVDVVDIFRRSELVLPIVEEAIAIGAKTVWLQQGIVNQEAAQLAEQAGLAVIMDRCIKVDHQQIFLNSSK